jgi:transcription-repair coupling factor (superfamily II helicase)
MDRLVCGDVGYGKTEVAMRAAFKAVLDNKQVAVLVPTTVLAQQHYVTFSRRLGAYPVNIEVISRFKTRKEQAVTLQRLAAGEVDIIIGTHRLAQGDIAFHDLGLVIIDEEHRFGVRQKERLKKIRSTVDVLALTATPIPRTLHMSLASIRDLSIINTPPEDRLAVRTEVLRFDEGVIKDAIEREMDRGGQVFFVHNRVQSMAPLEDTLRRILPRARVAVAHGQMRETELEKKMLAFVAGEYDVLLCTNIIESGLDIPSANTIIINRADTFGLAELYQLRGRVGRSSHRAYAYFMIGETTNLGPEAQKRLDVIRELCEPGSGFKVAAYDLEIRGAGELLGTNQSGQIAAVGFEMYTRILEETVREMRGEPQPDVAGPEVNIRLSQFIPDDYVPDAGQRLGLYKRFACVQGEEELRALAEEVRDRYGPLPEVVENIVETASLRLQLRRLGARELSEKAGRLYISFTFNGAGAPGAPGVGRDAVKSPVDEVVVRKALELVAGDPKRFRITGDGRFSVRIGNEGDAALEARYVLKELLGGCYSEG